MADLEITGRVTVDAQQAESAFARVGSKADQMARGVADSAEKAGKAVDKIGAGAGAGAEQFTRAESRIRDSIKRSTEQINLLGKTASEKLQFKIEAKGLDSAKFAPYIAELKKAEAAQRSLGDSSVSLSGSLGAAARGLALIGVGASVRELLSLASASTNVANRLRLVTDSATELTDVQARLFAVAQSSRVGFVDLAGTYAQIARSTKELGVSQTDLLGIIKTVSQAVTISGGSADSSRAALTQLSQGFASGALRGEELNSVLEQTPRLAQAIAEGFGVGIGKLREMGAAGELTADAVLGALQRSAASVESEFGRMATTVEQASTQAANSVLKLVGAVDKLMGGTSLLADAIAAASRGIDLMSSSVEKLGSQSGLRDAARDVLTLDEAARRVRERLDQGVVGPNTQADLDRLNIKLAEAKRRFNELYEASKGVAPGSSSSANYGNEGAREASRQAEIARRAQLGEDLNNFRLKSAGVPASYLKDMNEIIRLNKAGVLVGNEYTSALKAQQDVLLGTSRVTAKVARTLSDSREKESKALAARVAAAQSQNAAFDEEFRSIEAARLATESRIQSGREMLLGIEQETALLGLSNVEREKAVALFALERQGVVQGTEAYAAYAAQISAAIDARAGKQAAIDLAQEQADAYAEGLKQQKEENDKFWASVDSTAHDVFTSVANEGEDAFKRIGKTLKAAVLDMLYQMTIKKWIFQISGSFTGGGSSGSSLVDLAQQAYSAYSGGSGAVAGGVASGAASGASAYGGSYAAGSVSSASMISVPSTGAAAASGGTASSTMASGGFTGYGYLGYAALIAAAVMVAEKLYDKGYTRAALGVGNKTQFEYGNGNFTSAGQNEGQTPVYTYSPEAANRRIGEAIGLNDKWADILSGTTRMAFLFGRKLSEYGFEAIVEGSETAVRGYEKYKGGLFRSNKTTYSEVNDADSAALANQIKANVEGTRNMARALGYSEEAIDSFTGKVRINFKGVTSNAEAAERYAEAMEKLQFEMLNAASGAKLTKEAFESMMADVQASIQNAGISAAGIGDVLAQGAIGRLTEAQVGEQLSEAIIGGIYNTIAQNAMAPVAELFMSSIITPIFTAIMAGVPISQAISQAAIDQVVATAQNAATALNAILADPGFQSAISQIQGAIASVSKITTSSAKHVRAYGSAVSAASQAAQAAAQERYGLETTLLTLLGNTTKLRERELNALSSGNRSLQMRIWALEDAKTGLDAALESLSSAISAEQERLNTALEAANETESALNDIFTTLRDNIRELRGEVESTSTMAATQAVALIRQATASGVVPTADTLGNAISSARSGVENGQYRSSVERDRAYLTLANDLSALQAVVQPQLSAAEQTVALLESQIEQLDLQLKTAEDSVNALYGIDSSVMTVADAVNNLSTNMAAYATAVAAAASVSVSTSAPVTSAPRPSSSYTAPTSSKVWTAEGYWSKNPDLQAAFANQNLANSPQFNQNPNLSARDEYLTWHYNKWGKGENRRFATGGAFTNGIVTRPTFFDVGEMGEAGSEAIMPLKNIGGKLGVHASGGDAESRRLLREIASRLEALETTTGQTAINTGRTTALFKRVTRNGQAMQTSSAAEEATA